jgi:hypothetical protein
MKAKFLLDFKRWSLIPTIGVRTRHNCVVIEWLCVSLWLDDTLYSRRWLSKHISVGFSHTPTHISLPSLRIDFRGKSVDFSILGFHLSVYFYFGEDTELPF